MNRIFQVLCSCALVAWLPGCGADAIAPDLTPYHIELWHGRRIVEVRHDERPRITQREAAGRAETLAAMDLFASLTDDERASLARELTTSPYVAGDRVFEAGQPADSLYVLAEGKVEIIRERPRGGPVKLAVLEAPAYFGEMGLLLGQPRIATVVATNDVRFIRADDFESHEARVCIHDGVLLEDPKRPRRYSREQYLKSPRQMAEPTLLRGQMARPGHRAR